MNTTDITIPSILDADDLEVLLLCANQIRERPDITDDDLDVSTRLGLVDGALPLPPWMLQLARHYATLRNHEQASEDRRLSNDPTELARRIKRMADRLSEVSAERTADAQSLARSFARKVVALTN